jgi:hypothetical protein
MLCSVVPPESGGDENVRCSAKDVKPSKEERTARQLARGMHLGMYSVCASKRSLLRSSNENIDQTFQPDSVQPISIHYVYTRTNQLKNIEL